MIHRLKKDETQKIFSELYTLYSDFFSEQRTYSTRYEFEYTEVNFVDSLKDEITSGDTYVFYLRINESTAGFIRGKIKGDAKSFILHDLYLKPEYRKSGHGEQLFLTLKNELDKDGIHHIDILVDLNNKIGLMFWEKMGFLPWQQKMSYQI